MTSASSCNDTHEITSLSAFSFSFSVFLCIGTVPLNLLLIVAILGDKKKVFKKSIFYKLLLNITIADFLTGTVNDVSSIAFHIKEANRQSISNYEVLLVHIGLFMFSNVSILSMALLCVDRIIALMKPIAYRKGLSNRTCITVLVSTWFLSFLLMLPYFPMRYVKYLTVFSFTSVSVTFISLILVVYLYKTRFVLSFHIDKLSSCTDDCNKTNATYEVTKVETLGIITDQDNQYNKKNNQVLPKVGQLNPNVGHNQQNLFTNQIIHQNNFQNNNNHVKIKSFSAEQRVNQSFIIMLIVFLLTYLPACCVTVYLNLCEVCNCTLIHILRDFTYLSLLSSALWRSINFACRIITLNKRIKEIIAQIIQKSPSTT